MVIEYVFKLNVSSEPCAAGYAKRRRRSPCIVRAFVASSPLTFESRAVAGAAYRIVDSEPLRQCRFYLKLCWTERLDALVVSRNVGSKAKTKSPS